ncbi:hypothetical protein JVT61DRAFT_9032 [Boletus reticuloceps]|uniref:Uncharacterized protein n=1 Tax=Boletus reticuloceps TaxID=495285 RepID=A0A8I3A5Y4_9AGAM|nr:hypothetical protein JVT61DRAFT_9032 [Boletus reticuloceps]
MSTSSNANQPSHPTMPAVSPVAGSSRNVIHHAPSSIPSCTSSAGPSSRPPAWSSHASPTIDPTSTPTILVPDMAIMERAISDAS